MNKIGWLIVLLLSASAHGSITNDTDQDGVPDNKDACMHTPTGFKVYANGCDNHDAFDNICLLDIKGDTFPNGCQQVSLPPIYYALGNAVVSYDQIDTLTRLSRFLKRHNVDICLVGHADISGENRANQQLSLNRARAVQQILVNDFDVNEARLRVVAMGSNNATRESSDIMRAHDRRVEFIVEE